MLLCNLLSDLQPRWPEPVVRQMGLLDGPAALARALMTPEALPHLQRAAIVDALASLLAAAARAPTSAVAELSPRGLLALLQVGPFKMGQAAVPAMNCAFAWSAAKVLEGQQHACAWGPPARRLRAAAVQAVKAASEHKAQEPLLLRQGCAAIAGGHAAGRAPGAAAGLAPQARRRAGGGPAPC